MLIIKPYCKRMNRWHVISFVSFDSFAGLVS